MEDVTSAELSPVNGRFPAANSYMRMPSEKSVAWGKPFVRP